MKQSLVPRFSFHIKRSLSLISSVVMLPALVGVGLLSTAMPGYSLEFPSTGDRGAPSRTSSGGTRSDLCQLPQGKRLSALVPRNNVSTFVGEQASLWIHTPAELSGETAELFVKNMQTQEVVYQQQFSMAELSEASIAEVVLPKNNADGDLLIDSNQNYFWELAVICDASDRARDHVVQGFLQRTDAAEVLPAALIETASQPLLTQQANQYAAAAVWQETLELALMLKESSPTMWLQLLSSVELSPLAEAPLLDRALLTDSLIDDETQEADSADCCQVSP